MDHFSYQGGVLHAEDVSIAEIAASVGTPVYIYSTATLERHYQVMADAFADLLGPDWTPAMAKAWAELARTFGAIVEAEAPKV